MVTEKKLANLINVSTEGKLVDFSIFDIALGVRPICFPYFSWVKPLATRNFDIFSPMCFMSMAPPSIILDVFLSRCMQIVQCLHRQCNIFKHPVWKHLFPFRNTTLVVNINITTNFPRIIAIHFLYFRQVVINCIKYQIEFFTPFNCIT